MPKTDRTSYATEAEWAKGVAGQLGQYTQTLSSTQALITALKTGDNTAIAVNTFSLVASYSKDKTIGQINSTYNTVNTVYNLHDAFRRGDNAAIITNSAQLGIQWANYYVQSLQTELASDAAKSYTQAQVSAIKDNIADASNAANTLGTMVAVVNFYTAFQSHNYMDAIMAAVSLIPVYGQVIYAAYQLDKVAHVIGDQVLGHDLTAVIFGPLEEVTRFVNNLFGGLFGHQDPPTISGTAHASSAQDGQHVTISVTENSEGGGSVAHNVLSDLVHSLEGAIAAGSGMGLLASRMPTLHFSSRGGDAYYTLTFTDADTGATEERRFTTEGQFMATSAPGQGEIANRDDFFQSMGQQFAEAAIMAGGAQIIPKKTISQPIRMAARFLFGNKSSLVAANEIIWRVAA